MAEVKLRFNLDAEEVELVVDGQVALSSGKEVFENWVGAYNEKHKPVVEPEPVKVEAPVEEKTVPVAEPVVEVPVNNSEIESPTVETDDAPTVDTSKED